MIIGVDFDNTIVCYDALFHRVALERGLIPAALPVNKTAVRDHLRATGREDIWTEMQGEVYGARMAEAEPYPDAIAFFVACREQGVPIRIISHKTRHPYRGERHDLHAAARTWLRQQGFFDPEQIALPEDDVFFELTKTEKLARIDACHCTHFIDDLPELLSAPEFPVRVQRFLFDSEGVHGEKTDMHTASSWQQLHDELLGSQAWLPAAADLAHIPTGVQPRSLHGGANNRVFRLGEHAVVKRYFQHPGDTRDRFATEKAFYTYAAAIGVTCIPQALGWDIAHRLGVFEYVSGAKPVTADARCVAAALAFVRDLNAERTHPLALALPLAAEACLSIDAHLSTIGQRVDRLGTLPLDDAVDRETAGFVHDVLQPLWLHTRDQVNATYTPTARGRELLAGERCVSPSDFGFHNAIARDDGTLVFLDFEYAGWDDPAKLVCDFFCQPDVPVSLEHFDDVVSSIASALQLPISDSLVARCRTLLPIYQIKWSCILLNDFTAVGRSRRIFSLGAVEAAARRERQLARARHILGPLLTAA